MSAEPEGIPAAKAARSAQKDVSNLGSAPRIGVIDYGMGNIHSVVKGLEKAGAQAYTVEDPKRLGDPAGIVLPGVGNFGKCMENLEKAAFDSVVVEWIEKGRPFLGICLGLQLLYASSEEAEVEGLGVVDAPVVRLPTNVRVPHMGWNTVEVRMPQEERPAMSTRPLSGPVSPTAGGPAPDTSAGAAIFPGESSLVKEDSHPVGLGSADGKYFYFVHSYAAPVAPPDAEVVLITEHGTEFVSGFQRRSLWATQFHPEKSADAGLSLLRSFVRACAVRFPNSCS